jgi:hypothetical protein
MGWWEWASCHFVERGMNQPSAFGDLVAAVDRLSAEEQEALIGIVRRRLVERGRERLAAEAREACQEFDAGHCQSVTPDEIMREILS